MIDLAAVKQMDATLARLAAGSAGAARAAAVRSIEDAAALGSRSVTKSARAAQDGRPTSALIRRSRSYQAALDRLTAAGKAAAADLRACQREMYDAAYAGWRAALPRDSLGPRDVAAGRAAYLAEYIEGVSYEYELAAPFARSAADLLRVLVMAAGRDLTRAESTDPIDAWEERAAAAAARAVDTAWDYAMRRADYRAGRDALRPDLLHPDPTMVA
jgi:hypothetical protein